MNRTEAEQAIGASVARAKRIIRYIEEPGLDVMKHRSKGGGRTPGLQSPDLSTQHSILLP